MRGNFKIERARFAQKISGSTFSQPYPALFDDPSRAGFQSPKNVRIQPLDSAPMAFWNPALKSSAKGLPCGCNSASWQSQHTFDPYAPHPHTAFAHHYPPCPIQPATSRVSAKSSQNGQNDTSAQAQTPSLPPPSVPPPPPPPPPSNAYAYKCAPLYPCAACLVARVCVIVRPWVHCYAPHAHAHARTHRTVKQSAPTPL